MFKNYIWHSIPHYRNAKKNPNIYTLYNDYVLKNIIDLFRDKNTVVLYFSDHGEEIYDYRDFNDLEFDSYMSSLDSLSVFNNRLLDVTERCLLPVNVDVRFCITSTDVIHA